MVGRDFSFAKLIVVRVQVIERFEGVLVDLLPLLNRVSTLTLDRQPQLRRLITGVGQ